MHYEYCDSPRSPVEPGAAVVDDGNDHDHLQADALTGRRPRSAGFEA